MSLKLEEIDDYLHGEIGVQRQVPPKKICGYMLELEYVYTQYVNKDWMVRKTLRKVFESKERVLFLNP